MRDEATFPRASGVISFAVVGGLVGTGLALGVTLWRQGEVLGDPDPTRFIGDNAWALAWAAVGGGVGWLVGAVLGWSVTARAIPPSSAASWALRVLAMGVAVAGMLILRVIPSAEEVGGSDTPLGYDVTPLIWIVLLDTVLVVSTLLLVSRRDLGHAS